MGRKTRGKFRKIKERCHGGGSWENSLSLSCGSTLFSFPNTHFPDGTLEFQDSNPLKGPSTRTVSVLVYHLLSLCKCHLHLVLSSWPPKTRGRPGYLAPHIPLVDCGFTSNYSLPTGQFYLWTSSPEQTPANGYGLKCSATLVPPQVFAITLKTSVSFVSTTSGKKKKKPLKIRACPVSSTTK